MCTNTNRLPNEKQAGGTHHTLGLQLLQESLHVDGGLTSVHHLQKTAVMTVSHNYTQKHGFTPDRRLQFTPVQSFNTNYKFFFDNPPSLLPLYRLEASRPEGISLVR